MTPPAPVPGRRDMRRPVQNRQGEFKPSQLTLAPSGGLLCLLYSGYMADPTTITAAALVAVACQDLVGEAAKSTWEGLGRVAGLIRGKLESDSAGRQALSRVEAEPTDSQRVWDLIDVLDPHVCGDPAFRRALADIIADLSGQPTIGQFITQISGDARVGKLVVIDTVHGDVSF